MANLNDLTNEQRESHRKAVCVAIGLDPNPDLGHLDYIWMNQEDGTKSLVLYAKRGTTELLRDINGIDIKSLDQHDGPGYVSFKATATNKKGRQEIAVGAHETEGLKGKRLADSIATAQTRALRRVTLQFAGHGILDESEVNVQSVSTIAPSASLAQLAGSPAVMPPPQAAPSQVPGRDVTPAPSQNETPASNAGLWCLDCKQPLADHPLVNSARVCPKEADIRPAKTSANIVPEPAQPERIQTTVFPPDVAKQPDIQADIEAPKRRGRPRKPRGQVDISSPGQVSANVETAPKTEIPISVEKQLQPVEKNALETQAVVKGVIVPLNTTQTMATPSLSQSNVRIAPQLMEVAPPAPQPIQVAPQPVVAQVPTPQAALTLPPEKQKEYRDRLSKYSQDVLVKGGMMPSDGVGGITMKLRKFSMIQLGLSGTNACFTEEQWTDLFEFLDSFTATHVAQALVQYIDTALG